MRATLGHFFSLLDSDDTHEIDITQFIVGCLQLKGHAKVADLAKVSHESRWMSKRICQIQEGLITSNRILMNISEEIATMNAATPSLDASVLETSVRL